MTHYDDALAYANAIIQGEIPACKWVKLACQRHLSDLKKQNAPGFPFFFDEDSANNICEFAELIPHVKGKWAALKELIILQPWQKFILCMIFGWRRVSNGTRRFRHVYAAIPRKNGKSVLAAVVALWMWACDGEYGAEVYCGATTRKQAFEVFTPARLMAKRSEALLEAVGGEVWAQTIIKPDDNSKIEALIGNPGDGSSPSCAIVDEYHEHDTNDLVDTMVTGMGAREQPLLFEITTAGFSIVSPCYEQELDAKKVLEGVIENEELFAIVFSIDEGDDWTSKEALIKANPNYGISVFDDFLLAQQHLAKENPLLQSKFKTKHLNVWCSASSPWINLEQWIKAGNTSLKAEDFIDDECVIAADIASKCDLTAEPILFSRDIEGKRHYYLFARYWIPEALLLEEGEKNRAVYAKWVKQGHLRVCNGATIDFDEVGRQVGADIVAFRAQEFVFDPFNAISIAQKAAASAEVSDEFPLIEFIQKPWNFPVPMDEITSALKDGRFHHDGNPITTWCFSNVVAKVAKKDMFSPTKEKRESKIDGAVAAIMAVSRAMPVGNESGGTINDWLKQAGGANE